ncbi:MAG: hypothetical protein GXP53_08555 [Deltaproteobacteria bacterium]|nr:hypothetical protein [Deltaproteobacteria bacterium]
MELLSLENNDEKISLVRQCAAESLTVRDLRKMIETGKKLLYVQTPVSTRISKFLNNTLRRLKDAGPELMALNEDLAQTGGESGDPGAINEDQPVEPAEDEPGPGAGDSELFYRAARRIPPPLNLNTLPRKSLES